MATTGRYPMMLHGFRSLIQRAYRSEPGQTLVEYALIIALMSIALVGTLGLFKGGLAGEIQYIIDNLIEILG